MENFYLNMQDFFLKEVEYLRNEISSAIQETRSLERYTLVVIGAMWGWLPSHKSYELK